MVGSSIWSNLCQGSDREAWTTGSRRWLVWKSVSVGFFKRSSGPGQGHHPCHGLFGALVVSVRPWETPDPQPFFLGTKNMSASLDWPNCMLRKGPQHERRSSSKVHSPCRYPPVTRFRDSKQRHDFMCFCPSPYLRSLLVSWQAFHGLQNNRHLVIQMFWTISKSNTNNIKQLRSLSSSKIAVC